MNKFIKTFSGPLDFCSNFYRCDIFYDGAKYLDSESAFQAAKTEDKELRIPFQNVYNPSLTKKMGRQLKLRSDWESVKDNVMLEILRIKFSNPTLREKLLKTGTNFLEEGNSWHDNYWGVCYCGRCSDGQNKLGLTLMRVREELISYAK